MSTPIKRDRQPKGAGKHQRSRFESPELKEQFEKEAQAESVSLANWMKELGREALRKKGIEPKG
ncbi:toxin-antitoxin system HicB family antitoxin [Klebsiella pneumoniae]|uniref:Toxin-antitoxin system HicB family antitoxin n=1 Tax=Klebsiella pneumoniae TaxID=573 RepID=A0A927DK86_KLEPN|nr:toxin-antitoxin system HicB family antitoxin [Klebsiella pneumoniae]